MSSEPNLELCFLEYNGRQKVFAPQKSLSVKKVGKSPKPIPDSGTISPICNCETSEIIPFVGDPVHSRINLSVRALSQQGYINTLAVLDSGSEVNVIIDGFLRQNGLNWDINTNKSRPNQKVSFSGPSGDCLKFKGDIKLWVKIKDKTELTPFVILEGDSPTIILGNPGMKLFNICVRPGVQASISVRQCKETQHQVAASRECQLSPWTHGAWRGPRTKKKYHSSVIPFQNRLDEPVQNM